MPAARPPSDSELTPFDRAVRRVVSAIPPGTVLGYGEVAMLAGRPGGARAVVRALYRLSNVPWWRVVRSDRTLAPEIAARQAKRLRAEGVRIEGRRIRSTSSGDGASRGAPLRPNGVAAKRRARPGP